MRHLVTVGGLSLCLAAAAAAQDRPRADLFAGYSLVRSEGESLHGGEVTFAYQVSDLLAVVVDVDSHARTVEGVDHTTSGLFGGLRAGFHAGGARPFVHVLAGGVRDEDSITVFSNTISERHTSFGGAAGGGLDFGRGRFGARVQADYRVSRRTAADGSKETHGDPRLSVGVVLRIRRGT
jgi:hypothetical protein